MSQAGIRAAQLADQIRDFLAEKIVRDFTGFLITITQVTLSPDLQTATVWITTFDPAQKNRALEKLKSAGKQYQHELHKTLRRHSAPRLTFVSDYSAEDADRIGQLLK